MQQLEMAKNGLNGFKGMEMNENGLKWLEMTGNDWHDWNGFKWLKQCDIE